MEQGTTGYRVYGEDKVVDYRAINAVRLRVVSDRWLRLYEVAVALSARFGGHRAIPSRQCKATPDNSRVGVLRL